MEALTSVRTETKDLNTIADIVETTANKGETEDLDKTVTIEEMPLVTVKPIALDRNSNFVKLTKVREEMGDLDKTADAVGIPEETIN